MYVIYNPTVPCSQVIWGEGYLCDEKYSSDVCGVRFVVIFDRKIRCRWDILYENGEMS